MIGFPTVSVIYWRYDSTMVGITIVQVSYSRPTVTFGTGESGMCLKEGSSVGGWIVGMSTDMSTSMSSGEGGLVADGRGKGDSSFKSSFRC